jgi:site-specific DNA recombinase
MKRAVLYARVSGDDRGKDGRNLEGQLEMCKEFAKKRHYTIVEELAEDDRGASGYDLDLPELNRARDLAQAGKYDVLIVREVDRLARNLVKCQILESELRRYDVRVEYALYDFPDTPEGRLNKNIYASFAEFEREKIAQRMKRGRDRKVRSGKHPCCGKPPYGYRFSESLDGLEIDEDEASVVRLIFELYAGRQGDPLSIRAVAIKLSKMGVLTPGATGKHGGGPRKRAGAMWGDSTIRNILRSTTYVGVLRWGAQKRRGNEEQPEREGNAIAVPPIVSRELFDAAQKQTEVNRQMSKRNRNGEYLMSGRIRCGCGYSRVASVTARKDRAHAYRCASRIHKYRELGEKSTCTEPRVKGPWLDGIVWDFILDAVTDPDYFEELLREAQREELDALQPKRERLTLVESLVSQAENEAAKFAEALLVDVSNGVVGCALRKQAADVNARHVALCAERDALIAEIESGALSDEQIETMLAMFGRDVMAGLEGATFEDKRRYVRELDVRVMVEGGCVVISCRLPVPDVSIEYKSIARSECPSFRSPARQRVRQRRSGRQP